MNIQRTKKTPDIPLAWRKMLADIPNGGSIKVADVRSNTLYDGTPVYKGEDNLWHPIQTAVMQADAASNAVNYKVVKGHNLKVGDYLYNGSTGYAITGINTSNESYDTVTVGTTLGAASAGDVLIVGSSTASAPLPQGLVFGHHEAKIGVNLEVAIGVIGTVVAANVKTPMTSTQKAALTGIVFV